MRSSRNALTDHDPSAGARPPRPPRATRTLHRSRSWLTAAVSVYHCSNTVKGKLKLDPSSATPLWRQLEESIRQLVGSGAWGPGSAVPSVRVLAAELLVNPATIARAYQRLVDLGVLVVRRGEGT